MSQAVGTPLSIQNRIVKPILSMAREVENMIDLAIEALLNFDAKLAGRILEKEPSVNAAEMRIDAAILAVLEGGNLSSYEIRQAASMLKINKDLERMADLATNIGRKVSDVARRGQEQDYSELQPMAIAVSHVSRKTLRALIHSDLVLATNVLGTGAMVDFYRDYVFRKLQERVKQACQKREDVDLMLASRYLEQIADHSANVAESLIFWLSSKDAGDQMRKQQAVAV